MSYTMTAAAYANAEQTAAIVMTGEAAAVLITQDDTPGHWAALLASDIEIAPFAPVADIAQAAREAALL